MANPADLVKALLKRSRFTFRLSLWLYFKVAAPCVDKLVLVGVLKLRHEWARTIVRLYRSQEISRYYSMGDYCFHQGFRAKAIRYWKKSVRIQDRAVEQLYPIELRNGYTDLASTYWTVAIGHIALMDCMVKLAKLRLLHNSKLRLFVHPQFIANRWYLDLFASHVEFVGYPKGGTQEIELELRDQKLNIIRTVRGALFLYDACALAEQQWRSRKHEPLLIVPHDYRKLAEERLEELGWAPSKWFVTLHVRGHRHRRDRLDITRNATLDHYEQAVDLINAAGGQVVLLGEQGVNVPQCLRDKLIDYGHSTVKDARIDVYLCGACRFFLGTSSGISHVPGTFGVPAVFANVSPPYSRPWREGDVWIPKQLSVEANSRLLTLQEMMTPPSSLLDTRESQSRHGLRAVDNTSEDIVDAVADMLDQLTVQNQPETLKRAEQLAGSVLAQFHRQDAPYMSRLSPRFAARYQQHLGLGS
jgi:putative glycosyltransferase (TIGR04372 family)